MTNKLILVIVLCLISKIAFSQEVNLFINDIKEERHLRQEDSFIELSSFIQGLTVDDLNQVKLKNISSALDDNGNVLKKMEGFFGDDYSSRNELTIKLEAPSRKSNKLLTVEGSFKIFSPSEANGSIIKISNPLDLYNKNLLPKDFTDVTLTLVDKEALKKLREEDDEEFKKQIEQIKEETGLGEGVAESFIGAFKQFFEGFSNFGSGESMSFYVEDEKDKIVEILIYNGTGEKMNIGSSRMGKNNLSIDLKEKVASDWRIEIMVENEKSIKEYNFSVSNIVLP